MQFTLHEKLKRQTGQNQTICFFDIDGTIFTLSPRIVQAPFFNVPTHHLLQVNNIPFILITGRFYWHWGRDLEIALEGFPQPDAIIYAGGTKIRMKDTQGNYHELPYIADELPVPPPPQLLGKSFTKLSLHMYVVSFFKTPYTKLIPAIDALKKHYDEKAHVFYSESVVTPNTEEVFSGSVYVGSAHANKESAVQYILRSFSSHPELGSGSHTQSQLTAFIFGDGSIDLPMLSMKSPKKDIILKQYLVHPTIMARISGKKLGITTLEKQGPQAIAETLTNALCHPEASAEGSSTKSKTHFSPAQNNPIRKLEKYIEPVLDRIVDQKLSANDISLLGLEKVKQGLQLATSKNILHRLQGFSLVAFGNFTDVLDGIRARRKGKTPEGQLIDGYCDRAREFYQLYSRQSFQAALSCFLPSIARAQAEIAGISVPEQDKAGGSALDRTKLLMKSLWTYVTGNKGKSHLIDETIYKRNMATFENRIRRCEEQRDAAISTHIQNLKIQSLSPFQLQALERFLVYTDLFQQAHKIVQSDLIFDVGSIAWRSSPQIIQSYLSLDIKKLRKQYGFKDYQLYLGR